MVRRAHPTWGAMPQYIKLKPVWVIKMNVPDIWSVITGLASLLSLFISLGDKFSNWRKYLIPAGFALGGFAVGRLSQQIARGIDQIIADPFAAGYLFILLVLIAVITFIAVFLIRHGQVMFAYTVFFIGLTMVPNQIMPLYTKALREIPVDDYIKLSAWKVQANEYSDAIKYLEAAKKGAPSEEFRAVIDRQIKVVSQKQAGSVLPDGK
jgi:hypothetical protein